MAKALAVYAIAVGVQFPVAWLLMLIVGVVHADWLTGLPTIGYWTILLLCALLTAASFLRAVAVAAVKAIGGTDKPTAGKKVRQDPLPPVSNTVRMHWVDPTKFNRGLL